MIRLAVCFGACASLALGLSACPSVPPKGDGKPKPNEPQAELYTPAWAFEPWVSKDISNGPDMEEFLAGFAERDIPVGVAVLDSPWETHYNTFVPNEERYPAFADMVARWRERDIRTVLWVTQMVNYEGVDLEPGGDVYDGAAANFDEGLAEGYYVNDGDSYFWWKGYGSAVDFFNADARAWWHAQQDALLDMGIAGWKLDFGEQYITDLPMKTADGSKTLQEYSERYYEDFLAYGQSKNGAEEFITMVRPYDESYSWAPRFFARPEHAPVGWVGDQYRNWDGLVDALDHVFRSAAAGYAVLGSDIGGYLNTNAGQDVDFDLEVFQRWTAMSGMMPLFQLHGRANLAPWTVPTDDPLAVDATVDAYRYWAALHHTMVPYWYSLSRSAQRSGTSMLHPIGDDVAAWTDDWRYLVGDAFFVAPLFAPGPSRQFDLPAGEWIDWWFLGTPTYVGPAEIAFNAPSVREIPVFVKSGAIIPMRLDREDLFESAPVVPEALTVLVFPSAVRMSFIVYEDADGGAEIAVEGATITCEVAGPVVLRVRADDPAAVTAVLADGSALPFADDVGALEDGDGAFLDVDARAVWIRAEDVSIVEIQR